MGKPFLYEIVFRVFCVNCCLDICYFVAKVQFNYALSEDSLVWVLWRPNLVHSLTTSTDRWLVYGGMIFQLHLLHSDFFNSCHVIVLLNNKRTAETYAFCSCCRISSNPSVIAGFESQTNRTIFFAQIRATNSPFRDCLCVFLHRWDSRVARCRSEMPRC